jgi:hypothetical protein
MDSEGCPFGRAQSAHLRRHAEVSALVPNLRNRSGNHNFASIPGIGTRLGS